MRIDGEHEADPILRAIKDAARDAGITAKRVDEKQYAKLILITDKILKSIKEAEYVIADLSGSRPNVYYEAGYAHALKKPMVFLVVEEQAEEVGFNLKGYKLIYYIDADDLRIQLREYLEKLKADKDSKRLEDLKAAKDAEQSG